MAAELTLGLELETGGGASGGRRSGGGFVAGQGGGAAVEGEQAKGLETRWQAGDRSRAQLPRSTRGPAESRHCERRRGTARGRDSCTWAAGRHRADATGRCAGGGWHRGGRRGTARGLIA